MLMVVAVVDCFLASAEGFFFSFFGDYVIIPVTYGT